MFTKEELKNLRTLTDSLNDVPVGYEPKVEQRTIISWKNSIIPSTLKEEVNRYKSSSSSEQQLLAKRIQRHIDEIIEDYKHDKSSKKLNPSDVDNHYKSYNSVIEYANKIIGFNYPKF